MDIIILKDEQMMAPQLYETLHSLGYSPQKSQHEIQTSFEIKQDKPLTVLTNDEIKQYLNDVQNSLSNMALNVISYNSPEFKELPSVSSLHFIDEPLNNQKLENIILRRVNKNNDKNKHSADSKYWLTTCSGCNKACDDQGNWFAADDELMNHPQIILTHSICPDCVKKYYPEYYYELCQEA